ncbi:MULTISPECIES: copper resistance D family protein [Burkholderia]|uniref:copper resistance D family protein n=1 Tax=Burkholderia TaxID=32008 RepID=UPI00158B8CEE|nr:MULTISPECIES: CopD family protein [Burkholderia]
MHLIVQIGFAVVQDLLFAVVLGALACEALLGQWGRLLQTEPARWRMGALCSLAVALVLNLWFQSAAMRGKPISEAGPEIAIVMAQSHYGIAWAVCFSGVILAILAGTRTTGLAWLGALAGAIIYSSGKSAASHAADAGDFTRGEAVYATHLFATALWAGSVTFATRIVHGVGNSLSAVAVRRMFCVRLSQLATIALGVVVLTGAYCTASNSSLSCLPSRDSWYGRVLIFKLALVAFSVLLGFLNRTKYLPRLKAAASGSESFRCAQRNFNRILTVEAVVMIAVLCAAAILGNTSPPDG